MEQTGITILARAYYSGSTMVITLSEHLQKALGGIEPGDMLQATFTKTGSNVEKNQKRKAAGVKSSITPTPTESINPVTQQKTPVVRKPKKFKIS